MNILSRMNFIVLCMLFTAGAALAHDAPVTPSAPAEANAKPDRWRGLVIDETTPEDAIRTLDQPDSDKQDRVRPFEIDRKWLTKRYEQKIFRVLEFKKLDGFDKVQLAFIDGTLALAQIDFDENIPAAALSRIYGIEFSCRESAGSSKPCIHGIMSGIKGGYIRKHSRSSTIWSA